MLCHFPTSGDHGDVERFPEFRPQTDGWLLHGHVHEAWQRCGMALNVGVDVCGFAPVSAERVIERLLEWPCCYYRPPGRPLRLAPMSERSSAKARTGSPADVVAWLHRDES